MSVKAGVLARGALTALDGRVERAQVRSMGDTQLARIDYQDTFVQALRPGVEPTMREVLAAMATSTPRAVRVAMGVRDAIVSVLGLKTSNGLAGLDVGALAPGARVGVFRVYELGEDAAILGEDDRHLDFRLAIERRGEPGARAITMVTTVQLHNALGRAYFAVVKLGHRVIVPAMLRALARALDHDAEVGAAAHLGA